MRGAGMISVKVEEKKAFCSVCQKEEEKKTTNNKSKRSVGVNERVKMSERKYVNE